MWCKSSCLDTHLERLWQVCGGGPHPPPPLTQAPPTAPGSNTAAAPLDCAPLVVASSKTEDCVPIQLIRSGSVWRGRRRDVHWPGTRSATSQGSLVSLRVAPGGDCPVLLLAPASIPCIPISISQPRTSTVIAHSSQIRQRDLRKSPCLAWQHVAHHTRDGQCRSVCGHVASALPGRGAAPGRRPGPKAGCRPVGRAQVLHAAHGRPEKM